MFSLHDFVMKTLTGMVGCEPDYKVRQYALSWYDKAELTADDMATLELAIESQYERPAEGEIIEEPIEEPVDDLVGEPVE